jgi:hypothetical protein
MVFITNHQLPEIIHPSKESFDFPAAAIAAKLPTILSLWLFSASPMWRNQLNTPLFRKLPVKTIAVICLVAYKTIRGIFRKSAINGCLNQPHFVGRSTFHVDGDRKTSSVCNCHDLGAFAAFRFADSKTPFFAGTNVPSIKASRMSIPPRSYRSCASSWAMSRNAPCRTHCWKRLWHVWYGGYLGGRSFQGAPVRNIHNIPFMTSRGSRGERPRGSFSGAVAAIMGSIRFHCSFVSSILIVLHIQEVMSSFIFNYFNGLQKV